MNKGSNKVTVMMLHRWLIVGITVFIGIVEWVVVCSAQYTIALEPSVIGSVDEFDAIKVFTAGNVKLKVVYGDSLPSKSAMPCSTWKDVKLKVVYGDSRGILHILRASGSGFREEWTSSSLKSAIGEVFIEDIRDDGILDILCYTTRGKIYIFDANTYRIVWQNTDSEYTSISCMTIANIDNDFQKEIVFFADQRLRIYDGRSGFEEWKSEQEYTGNDVPTDILIADVDGDGRDEIVLNSGFVLDARFFDVKWRSPGRFGEKLGAMDIDGDGILELIGESDGKFIRVFDVDLRKEKL